MFNQLGSNVAVTVFDAVATVFCVVPLLFTQYGHRIWARSKFAKYSLQDYQKNEVEGQGE